MQSSKKFLRAINGLLVILAFFITLICTIHLIIDYNNGEPLNNLEAIGTSIMLALFLTSFLIYILFFLNDDYIWTTRKKLELLKTDLLKKQKQELNLITEYRKRVELVVKNKNLATNLLIVIKREKDKCEQKSLNQYKKEGYIKALNVIKRNIMLFD